MSDTVMEKSDIHIKDSIKEEDEIWIEEQPFVFEHRNSLHLKRKVSKGSKKRNRKEESKMKENI